MKSGKNDYSPDEISSDPAAIKQAAEIAEQTVDARHLYEFFYPYPLTYDEWISSAKSMAEVAEANCNRLSLAYRGVRNIDGNDVITLALAHGLALINRGLAGAMLLVVLSESKMGTSGQKLSINRMLDRYKGVAGACEWSDARMLHEFFQIVEDYDRWIKRQIKSMPLKAGRDYQYITVETNSKCGLYTQKPTKELLLHIAMAERIVMESNTPRAMEAQRHLVRSHEMQRASSGHA